MLCHTVTEGLQVVAAFQDADQLAVTMSLGNGDLPERFASIDPLPVIRIEPVPTHPALS